MKEDIIEEKLSKFKKAKVSKWNYVRNNLDKVHKNRRKELQHQLNQLSDEQLEILITTLGIEEKREAVKCCRRSCDIAKELVDFVKYLKSEEVEELILDIMELF